MPDERTLATTAVNMINGVTADVMQPRDMSADQLIAACAVRARLAVATALLDVAAAIRSDGTGASVERSMGRLTAAVQSLGGP
ncbi:hypothetical protein ACIP79_00605 [Streptomyces sp. NPDC088747]|uniref:hypothetical protein n=1 Tax=Streptomyces sp. NPDC088747 TaxID=3365886 RepID=UPI00382CDB2A